MGTWTTRGKIGMVNVKKATVAEYANHDAMLAYIGKGGEYNTLFAENVQVAADANKPCMAWLAIDPNAYAGITPGAYPKPENDPHIKTLDRGLYQGGVYGNPKRTVHGIIIDAEYYRTADGNYLTATWVKDNAAHVLDIVYKRYKLPVWLYFNKALYVYYAEQDANSKFAIEALIDTAEGISFPDSGVVIVDGYPADNESPYTWIPFSGEHGWHFWGVGYVDNLYTFIYNGDKAKLYSDLGFVPAETTPEEPETDPEAPENNNNGTGMTTEQYNTLYGLLVDIQGVSNGVSSNVAAIKAFVDGIKGL